MLLLFVFVYKESFFLDCHALQARNDVFLLPLGDVAAFLTESTFQQIRTHPLKLIPYLPTFSLQQTFLHVCAPNQ
ncbi:MAG: hypothetical protein K9G11_03200 [Rickettsiaceae bacterium]|nr:hypothetical protein [Rickettsiaceae bacterium]